MDVIEISNISAIAVASLDKKMIFYDSVKLKERFVVDLKDIHSIHIMKYSEFYHVFLDVIPSI